jgi:Rrf2 family protein
MRVSAKVDYAVRAAAELAAASLSGDSTPVKGDHIAQAQGIPLKFLENILVDLRQSEIVNSRRGPDGGYWLARPASEITIADVIRAAEGPLASVRGEKPESLTYEGSAAILGEVWIALRSNLRGVLENVTLADLASGKLPKDVAALTRKPQARQRR